MTDIKVGDTLRNNDPRKKGEIVTIIATYFNGAHKFAHYQGKTRKSAIRDDRIFDDGKDRHQGWTLLKPIVADKVCHEHGNYDGMPPSPFGSQVVG